MSYGFVLTGNTNRLQVDQDFKAPRRILSGSAALEYAGDWPYEVNGQSSLQPAYRALATISMPYNTLDEPPIVMVRPSQAEKYVGAVLIGGPSSGYPNGFIEISGQCAFDYAVFSSIGTAVTDGSDYGIELYTPSGAIVYSSRHSHPRLRALYTKPATTSYGGGYPTSFSVAGFGQMPWILANPLLPSGMFGVGEYTEQSIAIMASVNASFTSFTVDARDGWNPHYPQLTGEYPTFDAQNPYYGVPAVFAIGTFA